MSIIELDAEKKKAKVPAGKGRGHRSPKRASGRGLVPAISEPDDLRLHYRMVVFRALGSMARDWRLIACMAALIPAMAALVIPWIPRKYSATALVYPTLFSSEADRRVPMGTIDAASLVASEARLIVSDPILRAVILKLSGDGASGLGDRESWISVIGDTIRALFFPETRSSSAVDREVSRLRNRIEVVKDTRSYLISLSITARTADEAAMLVNTLALEYLADKRKARAEAAVTSAQGELLRQLAVHGEKHPKVLQSADALEAARADLAAASDLFRGNDGGPVVKEGLTLAVANRIPTSPRGGVILGLTAILGLVLGVCLAVWRDRFHVGPQRILFIGRSYGASLGRFMSGEFAAWVTRLRHDRLRELREDVLAFAERSATVIQFGLASMRRRASRIRHPSPAPL